MVCVGRVGWRAALALSGSLASASVASCSGKVESGSDTVDAAGGSAGRGGASGSAGTVGKGGTSGASAGSAGLGGTAAGGASGGSGTGGASGSGFGANGGLACDPNWSSDRCFKCGIVACCFEWYACGATPNCAGNGEVACVQKCVIDAVTADDVTISRCVSTCARGATITPASNDLLGCLLTGARADGGTGNDCFSECFSGG